MKKIIITAAFLTGSLFGYSQITVTKKIVKGDTLLIESTTVIDTMNRAELRERLVKVEQSISNNDQSHVLQNAEYLRLDAIYKEQQLSIKTKLAK